jgi:hypothetical protein
MEGDRTDLSMEDLTPVRRPSDNEKIAARWDELRLLGHHGVFETLFLIAKEQRAEAHIAGLREAETIADDCCAIGCECATLIRSRISDMEKGNT